MTVKKVTITKINNGYLVDMRAIGSVDGEMVIYNRYYKETEEIKPVVQNFFNDEIKHVNEILDSLEELEVSENREIQFSTNIKSKVKENG